MARLFLYTISLTIGIIFQTSAQYYLGARAGLNMTTMDTDANVTGKTMKPGFQAGLVGMATLKNELAAQVELNYSQKGFTATNLKVKTAYLELPVMAKVFFGFPGKDRTIIRGFVNGGPYLGYWMSNKVTYTDSQGNSTTSTEMASNLNKLEFGLTFGGGVCYSVGPGYLNGELRYAFGLTNTDNYVDLSRNRVLALCVSYYFPIQYIFGGQHDAKEIKHE